MRMRREVLGAGVVVLGILVVMGCVRRPLVRGPGDSDWGVRVTWYGHSCFGLEDSVERTFLIDPFDETVGYELPWVKPDVVLVTHDHFDHNYVRRLLKYELVTSTGVHTVAEVEVRGVLGYHDPVKGRRHGTVHFYIWTMGGMRFAHLGDIGQKTLSQKQREALRGVDVLFIPVGGKTTVNAKEAFRLVQSIQPRVIVPMHYKNKLVRFYEFDAVDKFLDLFKHVVRVPESDFQLRLQDLPSEPTVYVPALPDGR